MAGPRVDPTRTLASMTRAEKNLRFGIARGLTQIARAASGEANAAMEQRFQAPTPFTRKATAFTPASRDNLTAFVFVKNIQAGYLHLQETGGERRPKPGSPINVPVGQRPNVYGNIPRGAIARLKAKPGTFTVGQGERLPPGIYQRRKGTRRRGAGLKLLIAFERIARYRPRFRLRQTVSDTVRRDGRKTLAASIMAAFRTAK
jgi:hypothetical protein